MKYRGYRAVLAGLVLLLVLPALALAQEYAVITGARLNLREYASTSSRSLGSYPAGYRVIINGSPVNGWYPVTTMDGQKGYMAGNYLRFEGGGGGYGTHATVRYAQGGYVNLRSGPSLDYSVVTRVTSGTSITILDDSYEWNYVELSNGTKGYMHDSLIDRGGGGGGGGGSTAVVKTRYGGKVNVRSGPSFHSGSLGSLRTGTRVQVLHKEGAWWKISGGGLTGYMYSTYLTGGGGGGSQPMPRVSQTAYVHNPRSTQVLNLRTRPSQFSRSIGQYRNGTQVRVVGSSGDWCEVYVGTKHGYMMTRYLRFTDSPAPAPGPVYVPDSVGTGETGTAPRSVTQPQTQPEIQPQVLNPQPQTKKSPEVIQPASRTSVQMAVLVAKGSAESVEVYLEATCASLKTSYAAGTMVRILAPGDTSSMVLIDNSVVGYVKNENLQNVK